MKRIFTYETEKLLGEVMRNLETGWAVHQPLVLDLLHKILRDLRHGVNDEALSRLSGPVKVEEVVPASRCLSDAELVNYQRYLLACHGSERLFEREMGEVFQQLLDKYRDITE